MICNHIPPLVLRFKSTITEIKMVNNEMLDLQFRDDILPGDGYRRNNKAALNSQLESITVGNYEIKTFPRETVFTAQGS
jgi:hypothetical protein